MITTNLLFACLGVAFIALGLIGMKDGFSGATLFPDNIFKCKLVFFSMVSFFETHTDFPHRFGYIGCSYLCSSHCGHHWRLYQKICGYLYLHDHHYRCFGISSTYWYSCLSESSQCSQILVRHLANCTSKLPTQSSESGRLFIHIVNGSSLLIIICLVLLLWLSNYHGQLCRK